MNRQQRRNQSKRTASKTVVAKRMSDFYTCFEHEQRKANKHFKLGRFTQPRTR